MINNSDHKIGHKGDYQVHTERIMVNNSDHTIGHKGDYKPSGGLQPGKTRA